MTKKGLTEIIAVIDKSGSMGSKRSDVIGGFNDFLKEQRGLDGECRLTMVLFDTTYSIVHSGTPIAEVLPLDDAFYRTGGNTALLDAVGRSIDEVGSRLADTAETERPDNVVVVIITDGEENSSREYKKTQIADMVRRQADTYKWKFVYLGQDVDAFAEAGSLGLRASHPQMFVAKAASGGRGLRRAYGAASYAVGSTRSTSDLDKTGTSAVLDDDE